jgi:hypothetical protein
MWLKHHARSIFFALVLMVGAFTGVNMRDEDIKQLLHAHNRVVAEESITDAKDGDEEADWRRISYL